MVGRALSRAHHSSVWTASSLRVFNVRPWSVSISVDAHALHVCIRYSSGGWLGTVRFRPSFPPTSHGVRARSVGVRARTVRDVRGPGSLSCVCRCGAARCQPVRCRVVTQDHERTCVCALLCASGVALHNLSGFETMKNFLIHG